ncbi:ASKHA domain-containing protein [Ostreibacterium oceani]|uniref:DUF4445 domain-containing protein n=1 Tax=Ostreibacterium oceani TaxID=2654998 RepID=A0A6N7EUL0_9GAMM|nr:ASKHA domain-containing protein [Ostreibacterium oceani]MPV86464.1 DUF4445 domain-containing protein [Ostreibacterium oceani]
MAHKVAFSPSGLKGEIATDTDLLEAARQLGVAIESTCGGNGQCGKCQIQISEGEFSKYGIHSTLDHVSHFTRAEKSHQQTGYLRPNCRLACCTKVRGDLVIDVPSFSQAQQQMVRKTTNVSGLAIVPKIQLYRIDVAEPNMHDQDGDIQLVKKALWFEYGLTDLTVSFAVLQKIHAQLTQSKRHIAVAVRDNEIVAVFDGRIDNDSLYGVAFDVGSTTVAAHLLDLQSGKVLASSGKMNPQIRFGEDVMARVSYVMMNPEGLGAMNQAVTQTVTEIITALIDEAGIERARVLECVFVANPIMHHILLNIDPVPLGQSPFDLATNESLYVPTNALGIDVNDHAMAYILPCIAGHVGADAASALLSVNPVQYAGWTLIVDIGTNAEIILANDSRVYACSSPTGPAFEGAQISCGQRAAVGAIERVDIDKATLAPRFKIIGCDLWSDDPAFAAATADIQITGICGSGIIEVMSALFLAEIINEDGVFDANLAEKTDRVFAQGRTYAYKLYADETRVISVSQNDVRQIQLAKAALYAGIKLLMDKAGITQLDDIFLAGAFGTHIDTKHAMVLGIIPDCQLDRVKSIGNAAGDGAIKALLSTEAREDIETAVRKIYKIETAIEEKFQVYFIDAMALPNKSDAFPALAKIVDLPVANKDRPSASAGDSDSRGGDSGNRRRRRRREPS